MDSTGYRDKGAHQKKIPVISLFSGAMGLDLGLEEAGFEVVVAVECDAKAAATIRKNKPHIEVIDRRIERVSTKEILDAAGLKAGGNFLVCGGPSCQSFSTAGQRRSLEDPRGSLFKHFLRVVGEARPKFFIMENVKGMLSAAVVHRPLNQRGAGFPQLREEEELGSAFRVIVNELRELNYYTVFDVLNSADFGVPQCRERIFFLGSRDGKKIEMPLKTHSESPEDGLRPWETLQGAIADLCEVETTGAKFSPSVTKYLKYVPSSGNWRDMPPAIQKKALGGAYFSWGGRSGFYRRLSWEKPSPALTTHPSSKATMLCHPTHSRPLNIKEYARIQQFPDAWQFEGSLLSQYRQIGNAVPVGLGAAVGRAVRDAWNRRGKDELLGVVETKNGDLIRKMEKRPITILNPPRMRNSENQENASAWSGIQRKKRDVAEYQAATA